jgi:hypothetical protein
MLKARDPRSWRALGGGLVRGSGFHANSPILAGWLVAVAGCLGEAVKVALFGLPFAIQRDQSFLQAFGAKPV